MNRTIKETLTKLTLETGTRDWVQLLPLALYRARNTPGPHELTPLKSSMAAPRQPYIFLTLISLPLRPPLPYRPICKPCSWCNKKSGNPYPPHTVQTTPFPALIPSRLEIRYWYGDIRPGPLNPAGRDLTPSC